MYRIIKTDGTELGITDTPLYIKMGVSGCFIPASEQEAVGIAFESVPYNLFGHSEIENTETVLLSPVDGGRHVFETIIATSNIENALCDLDAAAEARAASYEDALCDMDSVLYGGGETV